MTELSVSSSAAAGAAAAMSQRLQAWVEAESPSSDLVALSLHADLLATQIESLLGVPARRIETAGLQHLSFEFDAASPAGQRVLLLCHYDTVWPLGSWGEHPVVLERNGRDGPILRGPGAFDMKAGTAQCVQALQLLREKGQSIDGAVADYR
nr:M20/M25/M40 family metallo-hydrolase [Renibacterium salmoninarum]